MTPEEMQAVVGISDDCVDRLRLLVSLLEKWQARVNLVGRITLADPWRRHILDSAQLHRHLPHPPTSVVDLGSGAGFPGLVLAIMGVQTVHLVESDQRKCAFLREANRITRAGAVIHNVRIESLAGIRAEAVVARALAPLRRLIGFAYDLLAPGGVALFLKGKKVEQELTDCIKSWSMNVTCIPSASDPSGVVLKVEDIIPRHGIR